jgi:glycosyltransferase involved in cell wall biosynthesis
MKVLWFSPTPSGYSSFSNSHNGAGWISSLEEIVKSCNEIELAVAFRGDSQKKIVGDKVLYYKFQGQLRVSICSIINDFKPDLIQIFGTENEFSEIVDYVDIPIVVYLQGNMSAIHNAQYPPHISKYDFFFTRSLSFRKRLMGYRTDSSFKRKAQKEEQLIVKAKNFVGRTNWDRGIIKLQNPNAKYFHCEEALRDSFLRTQKRWGASKDEEIRLISVISNPWYKGVDLILKTAKLLREFARRPYRWDVYGTNDIRFYEYKYGIKANDVNVYVNGSVDKETLVDKLTQSSMYVHTSYIDNSPNSICEAQYLGVPVLATYVGGIPSLVKDEETGLLFPANAPHSLAPMILQLAEDREKCIKLSVEEQRVAKERHNPITIKETILNIYQSILSE